MANGRDALGNLVPIRYRAGTSHCAVGRSCCSNGCGGRAVAWFRNLRPNTGPSPSPEIIGVCEDHIAQTRAEDYSPYWEAGAPRFPTYAEVERPAEDAGVEIVLY